MSNSLANAALVVALACIGALSGCTADAVVEPEVRLDFDPLAESFQCDEVIEFADDIYKHPSMKGVLCLNGGEYVNFRQYASSVALEQAVSEWVPPFREDLTLALGEDWIVYGQTSLLEEFLAKAPPFTQISAPDSYPESDASEEIEWKNSCVSIITSTASEVLNGADIGQLSSPLEEYLFPDVGPLIAGLVEKAAPRLVAADPESELRFERIESALSYEIAETKEYCSTKGMETTQ